MLTNEGFAKTVYFCTNGIPTLSKGVTTITLGENGTFGLHESNMKAIEKVVSKKKYEEIVAFSNKVATAISSTKSPKYGNGKKTLSKFEESDRGEKLEDTFGKLNNKWEAKASPTITNEEAQQIADKIKENFEINLDAQLTKIHVNPDLLSSHQRIILYDALYQGRWKTGGKQAAVKMQEKASVADVCKALRHEPSNSAYKTRIDLACQFLDPNYKPPKPKPKSKSKDKLKPQKRTSDPVRKEQKKGVNVHPWLDELKANANSIFDRIGIGRVF
jgi:hypothetical protein